jgi:8-oxo-dGTP pyrophosphatase MutT (NUDIX family)
VKAIVFNADGHIALFGGLLPGGVEEGETDEQALHRECLEEIGCLIEIESSLGMVIHYRDVLRKRYELRAYVVRYVGMPIALTTDQEREIGVTLVWLPIDEVITHIEKNIKDLQDTKSEFYPDGVHQGKLYNRQTSLIFFKEIKSRS